MLFHNNGTVSRDLHAFHDAAAYIPTIRIFSGTIHKCTFVFRVIVDERSNLISIESSGHTLCMENWAQVFYVGDCVRSNCFGVKIFYGKGCIQPVYTTVSPWCADADGESNVPACAQHQIISHNIHNEMIYCRRELFDAFATTLTMYTIFHTIHIHAHAERNAFLHIHVAFSQYNIHCCNPNTNLQGFQHCQFDEFGLNSMVPFEITP